MTDLQPGDALDRLFAEQVEGYHWDETQCRICGWPLGQNIAYCTLESCAQRPMPRHRADGVAPVSTVDSVALAALERHHAAYCVMKDELSHYSVALYRDARALPSVCAGTLAHAAVMAMLEYGP